MNYDDLRKKALRMLEISSPPDIVVGPDGSFTMEHSQEYRDAMKTLAEIDAMERARLYQQQPLVRVRDETDDTRPLKYTMELMSKNEVAITIPSTIEQEGRALIAEIEAATKFQPGVANAIERTISGGGIILERSHSRAMHLDHYSGWTRMPVKSHELPTEGGCSFDPKEPIFVDRSPAEHARKRQFLGIHSRWYSIEGCGHSHWTARHEEVVRAHAQVHTDLVGSPATDCQFCLLSRVILRHALKRECVAFVLRGISANRAAKTLRLIAEWMLANDPSQQGATINALERMISQIAKSPTP